MFFVYLPTHPVPPFFNSNVSSSSSSSSPPFIFPLRHGMILSARLPFRPLHYVVCPKPLMKGAVDIVVEHSHAWPSLPETHTFCTFPSVYFSVFFMLFLSFLSLSFTHRCCLCRRCHSERPFTMMLTISLYYVALRPSFTRSSLVSTQPRRSATSMALSLTHRLTPMSRRRSSFNIGTGFVAAKTAAPYYLTEPAGKIYYCHYYIVLLFSVVNVVATAI